MQTSVNRCCCISNCNQDFLFGRLDQAKLILETSFEGRQFFVRGPSGNRIDCMFFPCTQNEKVSVASRDSSIQSNSDHNLLDELDREYLSKPTILMCNPNALYYQQMVTAPNAYWLNFFLKRDINVVCWNYRGYGESTQGCCDSLSPAKAKMDAERVVESMVSKLGLRGKIGVYGRSIGGITACHVA